jgi:Tol biopolymer transport system component
MIFQSVFGADWGHCRCETGHKFAGSPKWSPDGARIVFYMFFMRWRFKIQDTFYARRAALGKLVDSKIVSVGLANGTRQEHGPALKVSPQFLSGHRIGYVMKAGPRMGLAFTTGSQGADGQMRNPSWSPDGKWVVYQKWSSLWRRNQPLFSVDPELDLAYSDSFPAFSHDGKKLALNDIGNDPVVTASVSVMDADGTNAQRIFRGEASSFALAPQWSPKDDGSLLEKVFTFCLAVGQRALG